MTTANIGNTASGSFFQPDASEVPQKPKGLPGQESVRLIENQIGQNEVPLAKIEAATPVSPVSQTTPLASRLVGWAKTGTLGTGLSLLKIGACFTGGLVSGLREGSYWSIAKGGKGFIPFAIGAAAAGAKLYSATEKRMNLVAHTPLSNDEKNAYEQQIKTLEALEIKLADTYTEITTLNHNIDNLLGDFAIAETAEEQDDVLKTIETLDSAKIELQEHTEKLITDIALLKEEHVPLAFLKELATAAETRENSVNQKFLTAGYKAILTALKAPEVLSKVIGSQPATSIQNAKKLGKLLGYKPLQFKVTGDLTAKPPALKQAANATSNIVKTKVAAMEANVSTAIKDAMTFDFEEDSELIALTQGIQKAQDIFQSTLALTLNSAVVSNMGIGLATAGGELLTAGAKLVADNTIIETTSESFSDGVIPIQWALGGVATLSALGLTYYQSCKTEAKKEASRSLNAIINNPTAEPNEREFARLQLLTKDPEAALKCLLIRLKDNDKTESTQALLISIGMNPTEVQALAHGRLSDKLAIKLLENRLNMSSKG